MAVKKLADFTTPTGQKGNLFDLSSIWAMILGVVVFLFALAMGQNLAKTVSNKIPAFDTTVDPLTPQRTEAGIRKVVL